MLMKIIRTILGKIILFFDYLFAPKGTKRSPEAQTQVDKQTENLILYHFEACPFCVKVRRHIKKLSLKIEMRDVLKNETYKTELVVGGGEMQAPCLRISHQDGKVEWMYESSDINAYLDQKFSKI